MSKVIWRARFETLCRVVAFTALIASIALALMPKELARDHAHVRVVSVVGIESSDSTALPSRTKRSTPAVQGLPHWLRSLADYSGDAPDTVAILFNSLPTYRERSALGSIAAAGVPIVWIDSTRASGLAFSVSQEPNRAAGFNVRASWPQTHGDAAPNGALVLADAGGLLDSISSLSGRRVVSSWQIASLSSPATLAYVNSKGRSVATASVDTNAVRKRLFVIATPSWESKFTVAAFEELGWPVDGTLRVSPSAFTRIGSPRALDTATYAAVIVLDSMAIEAAALDKFVRQGGGLVLAGDAIRIVSLSALSAVRVSTLRPAIAGGLISSNPRSGLEAWRLMLTPREEVTVLLRDSVTNGELAPVVVARRHGAGRVVSVAYRNLWRWRMEGSDEGMAEHRTWWSTVVNLALPDLTTARATGSATLGVDGAPFADMVDQVGMPLLDNSSRTATKQAGGDFRFPLREVLFGLILLSLVSEWASRRLRGAR